MIVKLLNLIIKGGAGSGNFGHKGRIGRRGGSGKVNPSSIPPIALRWAGGTDGFSSDGKFYTVYHGTNENGVKGIKKEGLQSADSPSFYVLTTDKNVARKFAGGYSGNNVIEYRIPTDKLKDVLWKGVRMSQNYSEKGKPDIQHAIKNGFLDSSYIHKIH